MNPYTLEPAAIRDYMAYHGIKNLKEVAENLHITQGYLTQLMAGQRRLNEEMRLRFQMVTRKSQDQLFKPNYEAMPFSHQSLAMGKYYGVLPYSEGSIAKEAREGDTRILAEKEWPKPVDGRQKQWMNGFFMASVKKKSGNFTPYVIPVAPKGNFLDLYGREYY